MGLDLALGLIVLLVAIRGWFRGFILQAIRLSGLIACVYAADPLRDLARPYVLPHLPSLRPELIDRLLWWSAAVISYVLMVGIAGSLHSLSQRQAFGLAEPRRSDQYAGFALGALKGMILAVFLVAGLEKYAIERLKGISWADEQVQGSKALKWSARYHPALRIWSSPPVQHFVNHVQQMGLKSPTHTKNEVEPGPKPLQAATGRPPRLLLPSVPGHEFEPAELDADLASAVEAIKQALRRGHVPLPAPSGK